MAGVATKRVRPRFSPTDPRTLQMGATTLCCPVCSASLSALALQGNNENAPQHVALEDVSPEPPRKRPALESAALGRRGVLLRWVCRGAERPTLGSERFGGRRLVLKSFEVVPLLDGATQLECARLADAPSMALDIIARSPDLRPGAIVTALVPLCLPTE
eukprot:scaffold10866_cov124-Isochrysis_galbana.AAC.3